MTNHTPPAATETVARQERQEPDGEDEEQERRKGKSGDSQDCRKRAVAIEEVPLDRIHAPLSRSARG